MFRRWPNRGNWGGALVNANGQLVGMNSAMAVLTNSPVAQNSSWPNGTGVVGQQVLPNV
jgi:S1-C subfamily serine protease